MFKLAKILLTPNELHTPLVQRHGLDGFTPLVQRHGLEAVTNCDGCSDDVGTGVVKAGS